MEPWILASVILIATVCMLSARVKLNIMVYDLLLDFVELDVIFDDREWRPIVLRAKERNVRVLKMASHAMLVVMVLMVLSWGIPTGFPSFLGFAVGILIPIMFLVTYVVTVNSILLGLLLVFAETDVIVLDDMVLKDIVWDVIVWNVLVLKMAVNAWLWVVTVLMVLPTDSLSDEKAGPNLKESAQDKWKALMRRRKQ